MNYNKSIFTIPLYGLLILGGKFIENKFIKNTKNASKINHNVLHEIIKSNENTSIGKKYNFININSYDDYKKNIPLTTYSFYEKYINDMVNGKENILFTGDIDYFGHTSGTTGKQKLIPMSRKNRLIASKYMAFLIQKFAYNKVKDKYNFHKGLLISDVVLTTYTKSGVPICSATSGGMDKMKKIMPYIYTSPIEVMEIKDKNAALYLHALFAIKYRKLMYIGGVFISSILDLFRTIENHTEDLINDLRKGKINNKLNIPKDLRKKINSYLTPDNYLGDKLQNEFKKGFTEIANRLWPNLSYIICVSGANFLIYEDAVKYYTGSTLIYSPSIAATEAFIGINPYVDETKYVITPDTAFFEFINVKDSNKSNPKTYTIDTAIENEAYEIVLTTFSGLYRYKLNDVVKITGHYNNSLEVQFLYRKNQMLNMVSEKTTENHVTCALKDFCTKEKINITDYTTIADNSVTPGKYTFFMEFWDNTNLTNEYINNLEISLDNSLKKANPAYSRFRNNSRLSNIEIKPVKKETFTKIKEKMMDKGTSKNQIKIPRVITNNKSILSILHDNII